MVKINLNKIEYGSYLLWDRYGKQGERWKSKNIGHRLKNNGIEPDTGVKTIDYIIDLMHINQTGNFVVSQDL